MDGRELLPNLQARIIRPLRRNHEVDLFAVTYPSPVAEAMFADLAPKSALLLDSRESSQIETFGRALDLIRETGPYDRIVATRFDLLYLKSIEAWPIWEARGVYFIWREYEEYWRDHGRVGDAIHVVDWSALDAFQSGLAALRGQGDMHLLYRAVEPAGVPIHFIEDGFFDSNTLYSNPECANPLYRVGNRPRLPVPQPVRPPWRPGWKRRIENRLGNLFVNAAAAAYRAGRSLAG